MPPESAAPQAYEDLIRLIHDRYDAMSKTYQRISLYLTQTPNDVAILSLNGIGERTGIHASSFVNAMGRRWRLIWGARQIAAASLARWIPPLAGLMCW